MAVTQANYFYLWVQLHPHPRFPVQVPSKPSRLVSTYLLPLCCGFLPETQSLSGFLARREDNQ